MGTSTIPVDLLNPGQVFACLGVLEVAECLLGEACGGFDWSDPHNVVFTATARGDSSPLLATLDLLRSARVTALTPDPEELSAAKWKVATEAAHRGEPFPVAPPPSPATLPALLSSADEQYQVLVAYWGDTTQRDNVKFWAGAGGYPGAALLRDALELAAPSIPEALQTPFELSAPQSSSFRFDWRRDYVPMEIGFSLNEHGSLTPRGYPLVEILAAIGMTHARPQRPSRSDKLRYRYSVLQGSDLPLSLLRAGLGCCGLPFPQRTFSIHLDWPGKEGQARCITHVVEEIDP